MGELIEINPAARGPVKSEPIDLFKLRWRVVLKNGVEVTSAWTPDTAFPSVTKTFAELDKRIDLVCIDGIGRYRPDVKMTFLKMPYEAFKVLQYKGGMAIGGAPQVIGIEVTDLEGNRYLVMRDGGVIIQKIAGGKAYVANNN